MKDSKVVIFLMYLAVGCLLSASVQAATEVTGDITGNTNWSLGGSPYWVRAVVTIQSGVTLTIDPGVVVKMETTNPYSGDKRQLIVNGTLSLPSSGSPVIFTSDQDDDADGIDVTGNGYTAGSPGEWGYIKYNSSGNFLQNAEIRYGGIGRKNHNNPYDLYQVWVNGVTVHIQDCELRDCYQTAIYYVAPAGPSSPLIADNVITDSPQGINFVAHANFLASPDFNDNNVTAATFGIKVQGTSNVPPVVDMNGNIVTSPDGTGIGIHLIYPDASSTLINNSITGVQYGLVNDNGSPTVNNNSFTANTEFPLSQLNTSFPNYSGNTITGNEKQAIRVNGTISTNGVWSIIQGLGIPYHVEDGSITIESGATLTVNPGVVVKFETTNPYTDDKNSIHIQGTLALPASGNRVYFTSDRDDWVGGDSNGDGAQTAPAPGDWGYLRYYSANVLRNSEVRYGGIGRNNHNNPYDRYLVWMDNVIVNIDNCTIKEAYETGVYYNVYLTPDSSPVISNNTISDTPYGIDMISSQNFHTNPTLSNNTISSETICFRLTGDVDIPPVLTYTGNTTTSAAGTGTGVYLIYPHANSALSGNTFDDNQYGLIVDDGSPSVTNNSFINQTEFPLTQIDTSFPSYSGNTFTGNYKQAIRVNGTISENGTWPDVQNLGLPYHVEDGCVTIDDGVTLTVNNGVVIKFEQTYPYTGELNSMHIYGTLELPASGASVFFTSDRDDTVGGDSNGDGMTTLPAAGDWGYLRYYSANILINSKLRYGGIGRTNHNNAYDKYMVWADNADVDIIDCELKHAYLTSIYYYARLTPALTPQILNNDISLTPNGIYMTTSEGYLTAPNIVENTISATDFGFKMEGDVDIPPLLSFTDNYITSPEGTGTGAWLIYPDDGTTLTDNTFYFVHYGLVVDNGSPTLGGNSFIENQEFPVSQINTSFPTYSDNFFVDNVKQAIRVTGTISSSGTWPDVQGLGLPYHVEDGSLTIASGAVLNVNAGIIIKCEATYPYTGNKNSILVDGVFNSLGTAWDKVYITSDRDDTIGGDSNGDGTATSPVGGDWGYLKINNGNNELTHLHIRYGGVGRNNHNNPYDRYMVWIDKESIDIRHCTISNAYDRGLYYVADDTDDSTVNLYHNKFLNSPYAVYFYGCSVFETDTHIIYNYFEAGPGNTNLYITEVAGTSTVNYNSFFNSAYGIYADGGVGAFHFDNCNISNNSTNGVRNAEAPCIVGDYCWWGHSTGPFDNQTGAGACDGTNGGSGDSVTEYVDYHDWVSTPIPIGLLDCSNMANIPCNSGLQFQTNDAGQSDVDTYGCHTEDYSGKEMVYYVDTTSTGSLVAHLNPIYGDPDVFILDACSEENCLAYGDYDAILASVTPGRYYIVVDCAQDPAYYDIYVYCGGATPTHTATPSPLPTNTPIPQLDCSSPVHLNCWTPYAGDTTGGDTNVSQYNCVGFDFSGPEVVHTIDISEDYMDISLSSSAALFVMVLDACNENACIAFGNGNFSVEELTAGMYYLVVDGIMGAAGTYTLDVHCNPGGTPAATATPTATPTLSPTTASTYTPTPTPTLSPTSTISHSPTITPTFTAIPTETPIPQTNCGWNDDWQDYACGPTGLNGEDFITFFVVHQTCDVTISINNVTPQNYDPVLLLMDGPGPEYCIAYADDHGEAEGETITMEAMEPGFYYAAVDSYQDCGFWYISLTMDNCLTPTPIPTETPIPQTNCGWYDDWQNYACGMFDLFGEDFITFFVVQQVCDVTIAIENVTPGDYDPVLLLLDGPDPLYCFAYADDNGAGAGESITVPGMEPGNYYAVVDSEEDCGYWNLSYSLNNCLTPTPSPTPPDTPTPNPQTNCGWLDDYQDYGCGISGLNGEDLGIVFNNYQYCDITIEIENVTPGDYDPILLIMDGPGPEDCFIYADENGDAQGETIMITGLEPGTYYAVVDSYESCGYFNFRVTYDNCQPYSPTPTLTPTQVLTPTSVPTHVCSTILVPQDHQTIQEAIHAALDCDTVLIDDGTYTGDRNKNLDLMGKAITLTSVNGRENCIIDCENDGRGFIIFRGEGNDSIISGLTVQNCNATYGAGIYIQNSSPAILECTVKSCTCDSDGSGIYCSNTSSPVITDCIITENSAGGMGGGLYCRDFSNPTITNTDITLNSAEFGGGIESYSASPHLIECNISENYGVHNGGIFFDIGAGCVLENCTIAYNSSIDQGGGLHIISDNPEALIKNCLIIGNETQNYGGGVECWYSSPTFLNCTFTENSAQLNAGALNCMNASPTVKNCIFWNNFPNEVETSGQSDIDMTYSNVQGGFEGEGNMNQDPMFVDPVNGDYHLQSTVGSYHNGTWETDENCSPCIDAGNPGDACDCEPLPNGGIINIGAYGNTEQASNACSRDIPTLSLFGILLLVLTIGFLTMKKGNKM